uniref:Uncharacterized protein n=1 Tax=Salix viminalis TaxID=40686 RepID=A0A6N2KTS1_SALVM
MTEVSTTGPSKSSWTCASGFKASYRVVPVELLEPHLNPIDERGGSERLPSYKADSCRLGSTDKVLYPHDVVWTRNLPSMSSLNESVSAGLSWLEFCSPEVASR